MKTIVRFDNNHISSSLEQRLISECRTQVWIRNIIYNPVEYVEKINPYSIKSVRQKLILPKNKKENF